MSTATRRFATRLCDRWWRVLVALATALAAAITFAPGAASAHTGSQSHLYLDITDEAIGGRVEMPMIDVKAILDLELLLGGSELEVAIADAAPRLQAYASDHLAVGANGETWPIEFTTVEFSDGDSRAPDSYVRLSFEVDHDFVAVPRMLDVTFDPLFDEFPDRDALLLIGNDIQAGVIDNTDDVLVRFTADSRTQSVSLDDASWTRNLMASIELGVDHIRTGPDHVLFVLVLLLGSVLVFGAGGWQAAPSFGSSLTRVVKTATMFTIAHTITFSLAGLGILPLPPSKVVESVIAISIAAAALHNLRPIARNKEWAIAFGFGLCHGMGFAALVGGLETGRTTQLISLLGRNIGIEIGQTVVIALIFPALFLLRRTRIYQPLFGAASIMFAAVSVGWLIERVSERDLGVNGFVQPFLELRTAIGPIVLVTILAGGWRWLEGSRNRLTPTAPALTVAEQHSQPS